MMRRFVLAAALVGFVAACSSTPQTTEGVDRRDLLQDLVGNVIVPLYAEFEASSEQLSKESETFCKAPDLDKLTKLEQAWREAHASWKRSEGLQIGPVIEDRIDAKVDFWPIRESDIVETLAGTDDIDNDAVDAMGSTRKGLPVIEYLVFDPQLTASERLEKFTDEDSGARRCAYLVALSRDVHEQGSLLVEAWGPAGGNFSLEVTEAGNGSATYSKQADVLNALHNRLIVSIQTVESKKLSKPLGRQDGGDLQPAAVESRFAQNSVEDMRNNLVGIEAAYYSRYKGADGVGFDDAVRQVAPDLAPMIEQQLTKTASDIDAIGEPLAESLKDTKVTSAFESSKELLRLVSADMAGALGTTPTFSDNDGD